LGEEEGGGVGKGGGGRKGGEMTQTLYAHMNKRKKIALIIFHLDTPNGFRSIPKGKKRKGCRQSQGCLITLINFKVKVGFIAV
jgi:hypothetical protein